MKQFSTLLEESLLPVRLELHSSCEAIVALTKQVEELTELERLRETELIRVRNELKDVENLRAVERAQTKDLHSLLLEARNNLVAEEKKTSEVTAACAELQNQLSQREQETRQLRDENSELAKRLAELEDKIRASSYHHTSSSPPFDAANKPLSKRPRLEELRLRRQAELSLSGSSVCTENFQAKLDELQKLARIKQ